MSSSVYSSSAFFLAQGKFPVHGWSSEWLPISCPAATAFFHPPSRCSTLPGTVKKVTLTPCRSSRAVPTSTWLGRASSKLRLTAARAPAGQANGTAGAWANALGLETRATPSNQVRQGRPRLVSITGSLRRHPFRTPLASRRETFVNSLPNMFQADRLPPRLRASPEAGARNAGHLRQLNLGRILALVMDQPSPFTRAELIQATGLSAPTVGSLVSHLIKSGVVR